MAINTIRQGSNSFEVKALQMLLNYKFGAGLKVDGVFGPATLAAVQDFQGKNDLDVDGVVGPKTWGKLLINVKQGANGGSVATAQAILNEKAGAGLKVDGVFGPATYDAVIKFQAAKGLAQDGIIGPNTWAELVKA